MSHLRRIIAAARSALSKRAGLLRVLALIGSGALMTLATPNPAEACGLGDIGSCVALIFIKIFQLLTALMGWILVLEVDALIRVAQYHDFVSPNGPSAVAIGWVVTRDLANMFFIVILLIIAFGTILGSSTYSYEKNLPRLLIMAVVINFSKTICGIFIDMGQVVMLTFVNGFKEAAAGNFVNAFQLNKLLELADSGGGRFDFGMVIAMMFAFILTAVACNVVLIMLVTLIFRIVMLWVLIILSPLAFLASAIPKGGEYYAEWWAEFKKYIISGPVLAFFLWLALASVQQSSTNCAPGAPCGLASKGFEQSSAATKSETAAAGDVGDSKIPTEAGATSDVIMNLIIAICILLAGLKFAAKSGVAGLGVAARIRGAATKVARGVGLGAARGAGSVAGWGAKRAAEPLLTYGGGKLANVRGLGGLGRAAVLKGEAMQAQRRASREKFAGTPDDLARLSPSAYGRTLAKTKDPEQLMRLLKAGESNPETMKAAVASGATKSAMENLVKNGSPSEVAAGLKAFNSNKLLASQARKDPELLKTMTEAAEKAAEDDPNQTAALKAHQLKYLPQLLDNKLIDEGEAEKLIPSMGSEELLSLSGKDIARFMPKMSPAQLRKLATEGGDAKVASMAAAYNFMDPEAQKKIKKGLGDKDFPSAWGTPKSILASMPEAVSAGTLSVDKILGDDIQAAIKANPGGIDLAALARNSGSMNKEQRAAASAVTASVVYADPSQASAMKGEMFQDIRPDAGVTTRLHEMAEAKKAAAAAAAAAAAPAAPAAAPEPIEFDRAAVEALGEAVSKRLGEIESVPKGLDSRSDRQNEAEATELTAALKSLKETMSGSAARTTALAGERKNLQNPELSPEGRRQVTATIDRLTKALQDDVQQIRKLQQDLKGKVREV